MKKALTYLCIAILILALSSCSTRTVQSENEGSVTIKNYMGKDVIINSAPKRIIILPFWEAEMVLDMIDTDRIVALSSLIDSEVTSPSAGKAAKVEGRVSSNEAEKIISLTPDLVLLDSFHDSDGSLTATLSGAGITVLTLSSPVTFEDIGDRLGTISKAVFAPEKGQQLKQEMTQRLNAVGEKVSGLSEKMKVMYYEESLDNSGKTTGVLCAYGKESNFEAIASAAGCINVCTADTYSPVGKETVINDWKPELLVVPGMMYDSNFKAVDDKGATVISAIKNDKVLSTLPAVKDGRIVVIQDKYRGSTSHYMAYAVEELAKACYPELFN